MNEKNSACMCGFHKKILKITLIGKVHEWKESQTYTQAWYKCWMMLISIILISWHSSANGRVERSVFYQHHINTLRAKYAHAEIGDKSLHSGFSPVILDVSAWIFCCSVAAVFIMACIRSALLLVFGSSLPYTWGRSWLPVDDPDPPYPELISFPRLWRASENLLRTPSTLNVNPPSVFTLALFKFPSWTLFLSWALFFGLGLASSRSTLENIETLTYLVYVYI